MTRSQLKLAFYIFLAIAIWCVLEMSIIYGIREGVVRPWEAVLWEAMYVLGAAFWLGTRE